MRHLAVNPKNICIGAPCLRITLTGVTFGGLTYVASTTKIVATDPVVVAQSDGITNTSPRNDLFLADIDFEKLGNFVCQRIIRPPYGDARDDVERFLQIIIRDIRHL